MNSLSARARRSPALRALLSPLLAVRRRLANPGRPYEHRTWERLRDLLAEDPVIRVPEFEGEFQVDARSHLFMRALLDGEYEPALARLCRELAAPDRDAVDVGANVGFFSVLLARHLRGGRVLAIEPSPAVGPRLRANLARNGVAGRVAVFEGAVSDRAGRVDLSGIEGKEEYGTIGQPAHPGMWGDAADRGAVVRPVPVEARTLDALVEEHGLSPGFVKLDVEGAEHLVVGGAEQTLRAHRPVVLSELNDRLLRANGSSAMDVVRAFRRLGYRVLDPLTPGRPEATREQLETPHVLEEVLCVPSDSSLQ